MADKNFHSGPSSLQACISVRIGNVLSLLSLLLHPELLKSFACPCFIVQLGAGLRRHSSLHSVILNYKVHPYCHIYCMLSFYCSMSARKLIFVKTSYQFTNTFMPIIWKMWRKITDISMFFTLTFDSYVKYLMLTTSLHSWSHEKSHGRMWVLVKDLLQCCYWNVCQEADSSNFSASSKF